jgi:signal transduction histidine kinase
MALEAGGTDYVTKPAGSSEILARVNTHLNMYRLQQKLKTQTEKLAAEIKERKQAEKEKARIEGQYHLAHKMEALGQLAAGLAHEFNNPLAFINSNLDALSEYTKNIDILIEYYQKLGETLTHCNQGNLSDNIIKQVQNISKYEKNMEINYVREDILELLRDCQDGTGRIGKIVSDFKSFAHPDTGRQMFVDINKCLESTLNIAIYELKDKVAISLDLGKIPMVEGYPQKLNQAFLNILLNAAQAIEEKGEIKIQTCKKDDNVIISISDTGCGIEKENLPKIFDPFFTTKDIGRGTGLGMNHTYHIIKKHRGMILVESTGGKGTTFTITLPARPMEPNTFLKEGPV